MKALWLLISNLTFLTFLSGQNTFEYAATTPSRDATYDVLESGDSIFTLIQHQSPLWHPSIVIFSKEGALIEEHSIFDSMPFVLMRIIKIEGETLMLAGTKYSDTCVSTVVFCRYNLRTKEIHTISEYPFCEKNVQNIRIINGLNNSLFIYGHWVNNHGAQRFILSLDSTYHMNMIFDSLSAHVLSIDFARKGYVLKNESYCQFYDSIFNFKYDKIRPFIGGNSSFQSHIPFGQNLILEHFTLSNGTEHDEGMYLRLVDSILIPQKKLVIIPSSSAEAITIGEPYFGGLDVHSEDHIWASAMFDFTNNPDINTYFCVASANSSLDLQCSSYWGYDKRIRLFGMTAAQDKGVYIYGWIQRQDGNLDPYILKLNEMCELESTSEGTITPPIQHITVYPNPGQNVISFSQTGFSPQDLRFELYNTTGELVFVKNDLSVQLNLPALPAGIYYYKILHEGRTLTTGSWVKM